MRKQSIVKIFYIIVLFIGISILSCDNNATPRKASVRSFTEVQYTLTFNSTWSATTHPNAFPSGAHFSGIVGMVHKQDVKLFELDKTASAGIEAMAEGGKKTPLDQEIYDKGGALISGGGLGTSPASVSTTIGLDKDHSYLSVVSMIAPSPDWFIGIRDINLMENGQWVDTKTIPVNVYDAGTETGNTFSFDHQAESPHNAISRIITAPLAVNGVVPSMGSITITRIKE